MDALRFLGAVRPAAPPQPSVAPPPIQQRQQQTRTALPRMWPRGERPGPAGEVRGEDAGTRPEAADERKQGNWVLQMLRVQPRWADQADAEAAGGGGQEDDVHGAERCASCGGGDEEEGCAVGADDGEVFDRASFSRLLRKVPIEDAKEYSRMSYLCNIAYMIPKIQPKCLRRYSLQFVTTSVQEKGRANPDRKQEQNTEKAESPHKKSGVVKNAALGSKEEEGNEPAINPFGAYQVMSSVASYLHSQAMGINPFGSRSNGKNDPTIMAIVNGENGEGLTLDEISFVATTNSVTSMVAAKEETRQAVADDLNSSRSCPSEWFICNDDQGSTRYFVVQGSETIASWQANLLFEPVKFEGLDVLVHRGIYEAAKGMYHQMLPYVRSHLRNYETVVCPNGGGPHLAAGQEVITAPPPSPTGQWHLLPGRFSRHLPETAPIRGVGLLQLPTPVGDPQGRWRLRAERVHVYRDHDVNSYLRSVRGVVRKEVRRLRKAERERWQLILWWPLAVHGVLTTGIGGWGRCGEVAQGGKETVRQVQQHARLLVMFLLPVKLIVLGALLAVRLR